MLGRHDERNLGVIAQRPNPDLRPGSAQDLQGRRDVLRTAGRHAHGVEQREPDAARAHPGDDLREEGVGPDDPCLGLGLG